MGFIDRFFVTLEAFRIPGFLLINKSDLYLNQSSLKLYEKVESIDISEEKGDILIIEDDKINLELLDKIISQLLLCDQFQLRHLP